ncbi:MAG: Ldh family oxidoreductase, partial [Beijerinckiaceae bacterium]
MSDYIFEAAHITGYAVRLFRQAGWNERDADMAAHHLITADLSGHPSHGMGMLPVYVTAMQAGHLTPANQPVETLRSGGFLVIRGHSALGQVAAADATEAGVGLARDHGMALV